MFKNAFKHNNNDDDKNKNKKNKKKKKKKFLQKSVSFSVVFFFCPLFVFFLTLKGSAPRN